MRTPHALLSSLILLTLAATTARAQNQPPPDAITAQNTTNQQVAATERPSLLNQDYLTGDWGGTRTKLADHGVAFSLNYIGEVFGNPSGGMHQGVVQDGRLEMALDLDFEKLAGFKGGSFHANAYYIYGADLSANYVGETIQTTSNIEAYDTLRLFDLWYQQVFFDGKVSLRFGQIAADDEFLISDYGALFINGTFGWAPNTAANLPSGGPGYPLATPGVRLQVNPIEQISLLAAVFDGDPGDGAVNGQKANSSGTRIDLNQGSLSMFELQYHHNQEKDAKGLPGNYKLGGWFLSNPTPELTTTTVHPSNWGAYFVADQMVWRKPSADAKDPKDMKKMADAAPCDQGLGLFLRIAGEPGNRNPIELYVDGGFNFKGLIPGRDSDILGLGVAYAQVSSSLSALDRTIPDGLVEDNEMAFELTYQAQLAPWWTVQPDIQYILHPGGNVPDPTNPAGNAPIPNAVVLGIRTTIAF